MLGDSRLCSSSSAKWLSIVTRKANSTSLIIPGKNRHLGLSECSASSLRRACAIAPVAAVQVEYSPFTLDIESAQTKLLSTCRELAVAVVAYSPIGRGMLTGGIRSREDFEENDFRRLIPRFSEENFAKNLKFVDEINAIAKQRGCTASQLTLAWLLAQGKDVIPIPGTTRVDRLDENLGALEIKLTREEERAIREACENAEAMVGDLVVDTVALPA